MKKKFSLGKIFINQNIIQSESSIDNKKMMNEQQFQTDNR